MAESTSSSSPPISRSLHKPLEYTSCIDTTPISTCSNINDHSSIDSISQARHCDHLRRTTNNNNNNHHHFQQHRILERDLRRLDINLNTYPLDINNKKLDRTESISLPTTPIKQISSFDHPLLFPTINNDETPFRLTSSTDYMIATTEQLADKSMSNSKR
jgi:hypothetical protein